VWWNMKEGSVPGRWCHATQNQEKWHRNGAEVEEGAAEREGGRAYRAAPRTGCSGKRRQGYSAVCWSGGGEGGGAWP